MCQPWVRVSYRGGGLEFPPPRNLKIEYVFLSQVLNNNLVSDCVRRDLNSKFLGGYMPSDPPSRHAA